MILLKQNKSIQFRLFMIFNVATLLVILLMTIASCILLEPIYKYSKLKSAINICKKVDDYYRHNKNYDIKEILKEIELKNNMEILIENGESEIIYNYNKGIIVSIEQIRDNIHATKTIYKNKNMEAKAIDTSLINKYLILKSQLNNGYVLYIKIPVIAIDESIRMSNITLMVVGFAIILVSGIVSLEVSKRISEPIIKMNKITRKMAKLDFSEKYTTIDSDDEINVLGRSINEMSDKLESTIDQLRKNNNELEKDIERQAKIDEMRRQFISDVSHELKTPIALIQGYAEGLIENVNEDEESRKFYAEVILDESKKMDNMVKKLLELMKLEYKARKLNNTEFNLNNIIENEIKRETVVIKEKNIDIEYDNKDAILVYSDYECISQIVNNYLTNAIKNCEKINGEKKIIIRTEERKNKKIRLFVYNTGKKIPDGYREKIWGRFYKIDSSRNRKNGTGIGLAMVKAIMDNYNNDYGVINRKDGVEFYCDIDKQKNKK